MSNPELKITIVGTAGAGKTATAAAIADLLQRCGIKVDLSDADGSVPVPMHPDTVTAALEAIARRDQTVKIETVTALRPGTAGSSVTHHKAPGQ